MSSLVILAKNFAIEAHQSINQRRKYSEEPYHKHCERVARLLATVTKDEAIIAAAWLHDVLEDVAPKNNHYDENAIKALFGKKVLALVLEVTDISKASDGNREERKEIDRIHLTKASKAGKTIKIADLIDNLLDIGEHDKNFFKVFKKEACLLLPYLSGGNKKLYAQLTSILGNTAC